MRSGLAILALLLPLAAAAQEPGRVILRAGTDLAGLTAEDRTFYCLWAGQLFSLGASFCTRQQTLTTCTEVAGRRPVWVNKENDKLCDKNGSATP